MKDSEYILDCHGYEFDKIPTKTIKFRLAVDENTWTDLIDYLKEIDIVPQREDQNEYDVTMEYWKKFMEKEYPGVPNDYTANVWQFHIYDPNDLIKLRADVQILFDQAIKTMDESSGDDDFYDYTPSMVEAIADCLEQIGYEGEAHKLQKELKDRGHYD